MIDPLRSERFESATEKPQLSFLSPPSPNHPQMRVVELVWQKAEQLFGMKIGEVQTIRRRAVGSDKEREEMFDDFDRQISDVFLFRITEVRATVAHCRGQFPAADADVSAVVRQAHV